MAGKCDSAGAKAFIAHGWKSRHQDNGYGVTDMPTRSNSHATVLNKHTKFQRKVLASSLGESKVAPNSSATNSGGHAEGNSTPRGKRKRFHAWEGCTNRYRPEAERTPSPHDMNRQECRTKRIDSVCAVIWIRLCARDGSVIKWGRGEGETLSIHVVWTRCALGLSVRGIGDLRMPD